FAGASIGSNFPSRAVGSDSWSGLPRLSMRVVGLSIVSKSRARYGFFMGEIVVEAMQWSALKHINDVRPIDQSDAECLEEIRRVLEKHNSLRRFGVSLLHSHFDLADDELMLETTDVEKREHWVRPVKKSYLKEVGLEPQTTVVGFDDKGYSQRCGCLILGG